VLVDTPFGKLGLAVCYDLRFPELFRRLLDQGAELFAVPSAFTVRTGRAHWEVLVRARAVENLAYVIAAAQGGYHLNGRETYGDSMIVNPWGEVLDRLARGSGVVLAISIGATSSTRAAVSQHPAPQAARMSNSLDIARRTLLAPAGLDETDLDRLLGQYSRTAWTTPISTFSTAGTSPGRWKRAKSNPARTTSNKVLVCAQ